MIENTDLKQTELKNTAFKFEGYRFLQAKLELASLENISSFNISIEPRGEYYPSERRYHLFFKFQAFTQEGLQVVLTECEARFLFVSSLTLEEIPNYFYPNSIALVFPYVRAFVSTLTLQANLQPPIVLPTLNLTSLQETLKNSTLEK